MNNAYLLIGGNLGNKVNNLAEARNLINEYCGEIIKCSSLYETEAWGNVDQTSFLNQALFISTRLNARQLMRKILKVEKMMGRIRKVKLGPRIIDIDILFFEHEIHDLRFLKIPHPEIQNRRFVLVPMSEIDRGFVHPIFNKTIEQLLDECADNLEVNKTEDQSNS